MTAAKLIDGVVGHDLQSSPDFVEALLQSGSYDGYMQANGDRPNCLMLLKRGGELWDHCDPLLDVGPL